MTIASIYAACRELNIPRTLDEISETVNADPLYASKCYRLLIQHLRLDIPLTDYRLYLSKIAKKACISEKTYRRALRILEFTKNNSSISYGKEPNALSTAILYIACIEENEKVSQARIAVAGNTSLKTLAKRVVDVRKILLDSNTSEHSV
jgi:transcription initiation factor TFIIB